MIIEFHKIFDKKYQRLNKKIQKKIDNALAKFIKNPLDQSLKNHALKGRLKGRRAFGVTGDIRVIFEEYNNYCLVMMLDVGTHNQVY